MTEEELSPGSKDWIAKYLFLVENGIIDLNQADEIGWNCHSCDIHLKFIKHGVLFGYSRQPLFFTAANHNKWTHDEKLKYLLFESLIFIHLRKYKVFNKDFFLQEILSFYLLIAETESKPLLRLNFLEEKSPTLDLEKVLNQRLTVKSSFISTNKWLNYIRNSFIFLDVILYDHFLNLSRNIDEKDLENLKFNTLLAVTQSICADGKVTTKEKNIFNNFLDASNLPDTKKEILTEKLENNEVKEADYFNQYFDSVLFCHYLLDISLFTTYASGNVKNAKKNFLQDFSEYLLIDEAEFSRADVTVQQFIIDNEDLIPTISSDNIYGKMVESLSNRWLKIIGRNKDKFIAELSQSKELLALLAKATNTDLSAEEKKKVKEQFKDLLKSVPSLAVFMLPGGAILLPVLLKIIPNLLPSAFRDNSIDED